ncbi:MAG: T9SS type A sorting domain-containing protein, partial [Bacteroidetes bacterium]|nr:T9SS type A sorting domain-containing protein [Bacteroidota bacterium]
QGGEPMASCSNGVNTVWYSFVGPPSGFVRLRTDTTGVGGTNALTSMGLFVLPGGNCQTPMDLFEINCAANNGFNGALLDSIVVTPGETYYIQVSGGTGSFCIRAEEVNPSFSAPINDTLCNAIPLIVGGSCNPNNPNGNNMGATFEINEPVGSCFVGGANSVWYTFIGPPSGYVNVTTNLPVGAGFSMNDDTELAVYELPNGDCYNLSDLNEVGCNQDLNANISHAEIPILQVNPGVLYFIQVSGYNGAEGAFCIEVSSTAPLANDEPCDAVLLPVDGTTVTSGNNMGATVKLNENLISPPTNDGDGFDGWNESDIEASVWYKFVAPPSGAVFVDLCNSDFGGGTNFDTQVAIYSSSDCSDFTQFTLKGANDDLIGCQSLFASYLEVFCLTPGETFFVLVDGWDGEIGSFGIRMGEIIRPLTVGSVDLDPSCAGENDGRIQVVGNGGNGEYSFVWNDGDTTALRTDLSIGIYTVSMEDGCDSIVTQSFVLAGNPDLSVEAGDDQLVCNGDSVELGGLNIATGGSRILSEQGFVINTGNQKFSSFSLTGPENLSQTASVVNHSTIAGDFIGGNFYALDRINKRLIRIDTASGSQIVVGSVVPAMGEGWTGLAYDPANSILYGLTVAQNPNNDVFTTRLYTIDPVTAMATAGAMVDIDVLTAFAIDNNGMAYGIDALANQLVTLDLTNGSTSAIGATGYEASLIEDADFDPETNQLYIIASDEGGTGSGYELRLADLNSGATMPVGAFTGSFEPGGFGISNSTAIPYSFSWTPAMDLSDPFAANPKLEAKTSGTYIVTVTDACMEVVTDTVEVTVSPALLASPTSTPDNGTGNGTASANASGGIPPYSYQWSNGSTTETVTGLDSGTYSVTVFDSLGCSTNSVVEIGSNVGIDDWANAGISTLRVYPNPTQGLINIEMELLTPENVSMEIIDLRGKMLMKRTQINGVFIDEVINIERFPSGIYLLKLATSKGAVHQRITRL